MRASLVVLLLSVTASPSLCTGMPPWNLGVCRHLSLPPAGSAFPSVAPGGCGGAPWENCREEVYVRSRATGRGVSRPFALGPEPYVVDLNTTALSVGDAFEALARSKTLLRREGASTTWLLSGELSLLNCTFYY